MTLAKLIQTILDSFDQDWFTINFWGNLIPAYCTGHDGMAVYKPDPSIAIAFGWKEKEQLNAPWCSKVANPRLEEQVSVHLADVLYGGVVVFRTSYAHVAQEGIGLLPIPEDLQTMAIPESQRRFVRLLHRIVLPSTRDFDSLFSKAGFKVDKKEWPEF